LRSESERLIASTKSRNKGGIGLVPFTPPEAVDGFEDDSQAVNGKVIS
jgi:hypothetical protein